ncbi:hypothetical protein Hanom_Chr11g00981481 [Helianthus anomalus]
MSGPKTNTAVVSTVLVSNGQEGIVSMDIAATISSPTITRSLNVEFYVEMSPGYERGPLNMVVIGVRPSSQIMRLSQPHSTFTKKTVTLYAPHSTSLSTSSPMFTSAAGPRDYYYQPPQSIYTSAGGTNAQYYSPADNFQFTSYSAVLTAAMSTPPHQPVVMP